MRTAPKTLADGRLAVSQPSVNGWDISYNPDDARWYVARPRAGFPGELEFVRDYKERRNAIQFARRHSTTETL